MCTREIISLHHNGVAWERNLLGILPGDLITSIGEGVDGVQYVGTVARPGTIYRFVYSVGETKISPPGGMPDGGTSSSSAN